jgi:hypothetical protein
VSFNRGKSRSTRGLFVNKFCATPSAENSHIWSETRIKTHTFGLRGHGIVEDVSVLFIVRSLSKFEVCLVIIFDADGRQSGTLGGKTLSYLLFT